MFFLEFSCFFYDPTDVGNLISGSSAFSKSSLNIWKFSVHILLKPSLENFEHYFASMWNECNYFARKVMLKILQARLQQYVNWEFPVVQAGFRKGRETRDQIANICYIIKKQESSIKTSTSASLSTLKPLTVWITTNCGKFLMGWEYQNT